MRDERARRVESARSPLTIQAFRHGPLWNFSYLLAVPGGEAAVIDPGGSIEELLAVAASLDSRIAAVILTHGHHDHLAGLGHLVRGSGVAVYAHDADTAAVLREAAIEPTAVGHGHQVVVGNTALTLLHTPGHTPGSVCVLAGSHLFTGDTLMASGPGRHALEPGAAERLTRSLSEVLGGLPPDTTIYPGHDEGPSPTARLGDALARGSRSPWLVPRQ